MSKVSGVISRQVLPAGGLVALFVYSALSSGQGQDNLSRGIRSSLLTFFPRNQEASKPRVKMDSMLLFIRRNGIL
ncbi:hypothetical protein JHK87_053488 [Glycine soja]|nr:hypothetical protein JHK87_053488 [Glycine soja]